MTTLGKMVSRYRYRADPDTDLLHSDLCGCPLEGFTACPHNHWRTQMPCGDVYRRIRLCGRDPLPGETTMTEEAVPQVPAERPRWLTLLSDPAAGLVREVRSPQVELATAVAEVDEAGGVLVAEAPTGIGKSFAYLLPLLQKRRPDQPQRRVVVAAPTKALQSQLYSKDVPAVLRAHDSKLAPAVVKGAANYACPERAHSHSPGDAYWSWLLTSQHGDRADYPGTPPRWFASAVADRCKGSACQRMKSCGYVKMRREAEVAGVVVTNHSLLAIDLLHGNGMHLGGAYDVLVIDEAHQFAEALRTAYTAELSEGDADKFLEAASVLNVLDLDRALAAVAQNWSPLFETLPNRHWRERHERTYPVFADDSARTVERHLRTAARVINRAVSAEEIPLTESSSATKLYRDIDSALRALRALQGWLPQVGEEGLDEGGFEEAVERAKRNRANMVLCGEKRDRNLTLSAVPVNVAGICRSALASVRATVLVSATLATSGDLGPFCSSLGLQDARKMVLPTTFDLARQGVLYVPNDIPYAGRPRSNDPDSAQGYNEYLRRVGEACCQLVGTCGGSAFVLCTANDELLQVAEALRRGCPDVTVVQQSVRVEGAGLVGDGEPQQVLKTFLATKRAVLVGSKSFWEGVDVPGEALELVIITKLPFPHPKDPLTVARRRATGDADSSFRFVDLMDMQVDLRQGAGRLIRTRRDVGLLAVLDDRLYTKNYGAETRRVLFPPQAITRRRDQALNYLRALAASRDRRRSSAGS